MSLGKKLTLIYSIALALIAATLISSYVLRVKKTTNAALYAGIINKSGLQRMMSQKIALLAQSMLHEENLEKKANLLTQFKKITAKMKKNSLQDLNPNGGNEYKSLFSKGMRKIYDQPGNLFFKTKNFIEKAEKLAQSSEKNLEKKLSLSKTLTAELSRIANSNFLQELNEAVYGFQRESEAQIAKFQKLELLLLFIGLLILILEVPFIFIPMTKVVVRKNKELKEANDELIEFSYRISHDLRAPVMSSLGLIEVIKDLDDKSEINEVTAHLKTSMVKLKNLISDILNLTKLKINGTQEEEVNIKETLSEIVNKYKGLEGKNKKIDIKLESEDKSFWTTRIYLEQSVDNLISNAIKYSDLKKENPYIIIRSQVDKSHCTISVIDNGIGIHKKYHDDLFGMFKRFHPKVSFGSGLGLYLVKQNLRALDGEVTLNAESQNTEFIIDFPIQPKIKKRS